MLRIFTDDAPDFFKAPKKVVGCSDFVVEIRTAKVKTEMRTIKPRTSRMMLAHVGAQAEHPKGLSP